MFETSVSPTAPLNLNIEYQNADLWGLWGGANAPRAPPLVTGLIYLQIGQILSPGFQEYSK